MKNPRRILVLLTAIDSQKSEVCDRLISAFNVSKGPAKSILLWIIKATSCQIKSQAITGMTLRKTFFTRFFSQSYPVIKLIAGKTSAYRLGILFK